MKLEDLPGDACERCGGEMPWRSFGGFKVKRINARYCSKKCQVGSYHDLVSEALAGARAGRVCIGCGRIFDAKRSTQTFCSHPCGDAFRYRTRDREQRARKRAAVT